MEFILNLYVGHNPHNVIGVNFYTGGIASDMNCYSHKKLTEGKTAILSLTICSVLRLMSADTATLELSKTPLMVRGP